MVYFQWIRSPDRRAGFAQLLKFIKVSNPGGEAGFVKIPEPLFWVMVSFGNLSNYHEA
jgi:hypothetical protein